MVLAIVGIQQLAFFINKTLRQSNMASKNELFVLLEGLMIKSGVNSQEKMDFGGFGPVSIHEVCG